MKRSELCASQTPEGDPVFSPDDPDARERLEKTLDALTQVLSLLRELKRRADKGSKGALRWSHPEHDFFEVDHPASQDLKRRRLEKMGIAAPANLSFCPIDFESVTLEAGLEAGSFDRGRPSFFSWLGVTQYLTRDAVLTTLRFVCGLASGSQILFEVLLPDASLSARERKVAEFAAESSASRGEPWLSRFEVSEMRAHLAELGYRSCAHLSTEEAQARYFQGRTDGLRAPAMAQLLVATV